MKTVGVVLAAGAGRRMGRPKQLMGIEGGPMLEHVVKQWLESRLDEVILVLGYRADDLRAHLRLERSRLHVVIAADWQEGMAASLRAGVRAAGDADSVLIGLGDMPWVTPEIVDCLVARAGSSERGMVAPFVGRRRGHPVLFKRNHFEALLALQGDRGAAVLLQAHPEDVEKVPVSTRAVLRDVDRPEDLPDAELPRVVLRGGGDLGSGVAHRLFVSGFPVLILELAQPRMIRGSVSFARAAYEGSCRIEGVECRRSPEPPPFWLLESGARPPFIPMLADAEGLWRELLRFDVLVDARMQKRAGGTEAAQARLVIGLGPGFEAPRDAHYVIETHRGHYLGRVIDRGGALPDTGIPGTVGGESERRVVHAPDGGIFRRRLEPGARVEAGDALGELDGAPVRARMAGQVRGLLEDGLRVEPGEKLADVDGRPGIDLKTISDKARAVGGGVLEAIMRWRFGYSAES
ncbi:MAG: EF2563 family selenium-dependent molybdenum hydroxylase system protein [Armatimonadetes bacterium]|nr:EF2563 family selenium-dependent molybdenum hydroxylase system protein [Armatimonadota bacterium]